MANYQRSVMSRNTLLALIETDPDPGVVRLSSTGEIVPAPAYDKLLSGLSSGLYEQVERAYPRRVMLESDAWELVGVDMASRTALVRLDAYSGPRYVSCDLTVRQNKYA